MKSTTLLDFEEGGLPEAMDFFLQNRRLSADAFQQRVQDVFGVPAARDPLLRERVNEITLLYLDDLHKRNDDRLETDP
ncbi:MAG: hypothetical protein PHW93_05670 [Candidatus Methanomethylophilaceae archaeon]|jgi:hypothetical protein|nr:hypothetical protein [Candidatus Methanomethylophilaceae archaeon]